MQDQITLKNEFGQEANLTEEQLLQMQKESGRDAKINRLEEGVFQKKVLLEG